MQLYYIFYICFLYDEVCLMFSLWCAVEQCLELAPNIMQCYYIALYVFPLLYDEVFLLFSLWCACRSSAWSWHLIYAVLLYSVIIYFICVIFSCDMMSVFLLFSLWCAVEQCLELAPNICSVIIYFIYVFSMIWWGIFIVQSVMCCRTVLGVGT